MSYPPPFTPDTPWGFSIPLDPAQRTYAFLVVHRGEIRVPPEPVLRLPPFRASDQRGWVTVAEVAGARRGLLNEQAQWVVAPSAELPRGPAWRGPDQPPFGLTPTDVSGKAFEDENGRTLRTEPLAFSTGFLSPQHVAVALLDEGSDESRGTWGLLKPDGRFIPAPPDALEPLTDGDRLIPSAMDHGPLIGFLTVDRGVVWVDAEGEPMFRAHYDGRQVNVMDASGHSVWTHQAADDDAPCWPPHAYFSAAPTDHLEPPLSDGLNGLPALVAAMCERAELRLHRLARGEAIGASEDDEDGVDQVPVDVEGDYDYADDDWDEFTGHEWHRRHTAVMRRVARAYLDEEKNALYDHFLSHRQQAAIGRLASDAVQLLRARYGPSDTDPEWAIPDRYAAQDVDAWRFKLAQAVQGDDRDLPESRELWAGLFTRFDTGDGDAWAEIWLAVAPSIDALHAAERSRSGIDVAEQPEDGESFDDSDSNEDDVDDTEDEYEDEDDDEDGSPSWDGGATALHALKDVSDAELTTALKDGELSLDQVPRERLDDAMVAAALQADETAVAHVPRRWMTPERYALAVKHAVKTFRAVPPEMLSEAACIHHVSVYGFFLRDIPPPWRTVTVMAHAVRQSKAVLNACVPTELKAEVEQAVKKLAGRRK